MRHLFMCGLALVAAAAVLGVTGCKDSPQRAERDVAKTPAPVSTIEAIPPLAKTPWTRTSYGVWLPVAEDQIDQLQRSRGRIALGERLVYVDVSGQSGRLYPSPTQPLTSLSAPIHVKIESLDDPQVKRALASLTSYKLGISFGVRRERISRAELRQLRNLIIPDQTRPDTNLAGLTELSELRMLDLSSASRIDDADLAHLAGLGSLRALDLSYTDATDKTARALAKLTNLQFLSLEYTKLTDSAVESLAKLRGLRYLSLRGTQITSSSMEKLSELKALEHLDLGYLPIDDTALAFVAKLPSLRSLSLAGNGKFTAEGIKLIASMTTLSELDLSSTDGWRDLPKQQTPVTDDVLAEVAKLKTLRSLVLEDVHAFTDVGLRHLASLPNLNTLNLSRSSLTESAVAALSTIKSLHTLNIRRAGRPPGYDAKPGGASLEHLAQLPSLRSLDASGMQITDAELVQIGNLSKLESLRLSQNAELTGVGLIHLTKLTQLRSLNLAGCENLTRAGLRRLAKLASLRSLRLDHTPLTDRSLAGLATLESLTDLSILGTRKVTDRGIEKLKQALPSLVVDD